MPEQYIIHGVVLPERSHLNFNCTVGFVPNINRSPVELDIRIILNQLLVFVETQIEWDIFDLQNVVKYNIKLMLAMVGYINGYKYDVDIKRITNKNKGVDHVFGIQLSCFENRSTSVNLVDSINKLIIHVQGQHGQFIHRCLNDLVSAIDDADDTGFYCYRAIESLRHHCAAVNGLSDDTESKQWEKFRDVSGSTRETIDVLKNAAKPLRHGEPSTIDWSTRKNILLSTWSIVDNYIGII